MTPSEEMKQLYEVVDAIFKSGSVNEKDQSIRAYAEDLPDDIYHDIHLSIKIENHNEPYYNVVLNQVFVKADSDRNNTTAYNYAGFSEATQLTFRVKYYKNKYDVWGLNTKSKTLPEISTILREYIRDKKINVLLDGH